MSDGRWSLSAVASAMKVALVVAGGDARQAVGFIRSPSAVLYYGHGVLDAIPSVQCVPSATTDQLRTDLWLRAALRFVEPSRHCETEGTPILIHQQIAHQD